MKPNHLLQADPWLRVLVANPSDAYDAAWAFQREGRGRVASRVLRGRKMRTIAALYDEIGAALQFPPYFGENANALDECLADLEWLPADAYVVTILDAIHLLDQEGAEPRRTFWETLERVAREWGEPVGASTPRPAKAFRVIVQCMAGEEARMRERLPAVDAPPRS